MKVIHGVDEEGGVNEDAARGERGPMKRTWLEPHRVLLVDDDEDTVQVLRMLLSAMGHEVEAVTTGAEAQVCAQRLEPEIALIDLQLGDTDGFTLARALRAQASGRPLGLIALTGHNVRARCLAAGFHRHVLKPVNAAAIDLEMRIACALSRGAGGGDAR